MAKRGGRRGNKRDRDAQALIRRTQKGAGVQPSDLSEPDTYRDDRRRTSRPSGPVRGIEQTPSKGSTRSSHATRIYDSTTPEQYAQTGDIVRLLSDGKQDRGGPDSGMFRYKVGTKELLIADDLPQGSYIKIDGIRSSVVVTGSQLSTQELSRHGLKVEQVKPQPPENPYADGISSLRDIKGNRYQSQLQFLQGLEVTVNDADISGSDEAKSLFDRARSDMESITNLDTRRAVIDYMEANVMPKLIEFISQEPQAPTFPTTIESLDDFPTGHYDQMIERMRELETLTANRGFKSNDAANMALINARGELRDAQDQEGIDVIRDYMSASAFKELDQLIAQNAFGREDTKKQRGSKPPKAKDTTSARTVATDYDPNALYFVLAWANHRGMNPLVIVADEVLYNGDANTLADRVEGMSQTEVPEDQRPSYKAIGKVMDEYKKPVPKDKDGRRYLANFFDQGSDKNTRFRSHWRQVDVETLDGVLTVPGMDVTTAFSIEIQLSQEVYGGLKRGLMGFNNGRDRYSPRSST